MSYCSNLKRLASERAAARQVQEARELMATYGKYYPSGTSNVRDRSASISRRGSAKLPQTHRVAESLGSLHSDAITSRGMSRSHLKTFFDYSKMKTMLDTAGDIIVVLSASIAAGSGISAWRLLRRVKNLEEQSKSHDQQIVGMRKKLWENEQKWHNQAVFNSVIQDELDSEPEPAPQQTGRRGTPRPTSAKGLLYGRTRQGP